LIVPTERLRARHALFLAILAISIVVASGGAAAAEPTGGKAWRSPASRIDRVIQIARRQVGDPWRYGHKGPGAFDCSGLVYYAFREAYALKAIGGGYRSASSLYAYFRARGRANRHSPRPGDLAIWGGGKHVGIYIGRGRAVSALVSGVQVHRVHDLTDPLTAYLHLRW
jgi:cell wall-associated NlpC family hydrolase